MAKTYTVKSSDTLSKISVKFYGEPSRWTEIVKANPQLEERKILSDGSPVIFTGDNLIIPGAGGGSGSGAEKVLLDENAEQDMGIKGQGKFFTGFTGYTLVRSVNGVDGFSFSAYWNSANPALKEAFKPFSYPVFDVYFDKDKIFKGIIMPPTPEVKPSNEVITVQGYPYCGVLVDSCLPPTLYPAEYSGMTLKEIAETVCEPFGVGVTIKGDTGAAFDKVEIGLDDKIWDFLMKLCEQRNLFMTNTADGDLLIYKPETEKVSASFIQGETPFISCAPDFNGQKMFSHITGYTKTSAENDSAKYTYENKMLIKKGILRCYGQAIDDATKGTLEESVKSIAGRMFAKCVKYKLSVSGHRDKNDKLYHKNMTVSVKAAGAEIYRETKFIADEVILKRDDQNGEITEFTLVLPESRTGEIPEVFPWEE